MFTFYEFYVNVYQCGVIIIKYLKAHASSIFAGMSISVAVYISTIVAYSVDSPSIARLLAAIVFPIGLLLCFVTKSKLFTGQTLLLKSVLRGEMTLAKALLSLLTTYCGNIIGSIIVVAVLLNARSSVNQAVVDTINAAAQSKAGASFLAVLLSGIVCNLCVSGAAELKSRGYHTVISLIPVSVFVLLATEHVVANFTYYTQAVYTGALSFGAIPINLLAATIGNLLGGFFISIFSYKTK